MANSTDDLLRAIGDFIKGKTASGAGDLAKLSWEGPPGPSFPAPTKHSATYKEFSQEYRHIVAALRKCHLEKTLAVIGAMLTLPELQSNCFRLEILAHLTLIHARGENYPTPTQIASWFSQLDKGTCGLQEDSSEDVFISSVYFSNKNYLLFGGLAEGNSFYTQLFLNIVDSMPSDRGYQKLKESIASLLLISNIVATRSGLKRNDVGQRTPISKIGKASNHTIKELKRRTVISTSELTSLGVDMESISVFTLNPSDSSLVNECEPSRSLFEFKPIVTDGESIVLALPTSIGIAIRSFIIESCIDRSMRDQLSIALCNAYSSLFQGERILRDLPAIKLDLFNYGNFSSAQIAIKFDEGRYISLIFLVDGLNDYENGGFSGRNLVTAASSFVDLSQKRIEDELRAEADFKEGLSIIVACGWGRAFELYLPKKRSGWHTEVLSGHDLYVLGHHPGFHLLDVLRVLQALDLSQGLGVQIVNLNGFLNIYGWIRRNKGHIVPHERLDDDFIVPGVNSILHIPQSCLLDVRKEAAEASDVHISKRPDGTHSLVRRVNGSPRYGRRSLSPFYADVEALQSRCFRSVYEDDRCDFWIEVRANANLGPDIHFNLSNMAMNWAEAVYRTVSETCVDITSDSFFCVMNFLDEVLPSYDELVPDDAAIDRLFNFQINLGRSHIVIEVGAGFLAASRRSDNAGERGLVHALVRSCVGCVSPRLPEEAVAKIIDKIVGDAGARHFHAFSAPDVRDLVSGSLPSSGTIIDVIDDANNRLGLGWICRDKSEGGNIEGRRECCTYLNSLVRAVAQRIIEQLRKFDRTTLIRELIVNHESLFNELATWQRTFRAVRALSDDTALVMESATDKIAHINAGSLASRIIAEMALSESPIQDGIIPGRYDIGKLLADASLMFHLGGYSDAMNADMMLPKIRIAPTGDVLMDHGFTDAVITPFGRQYQSHSLEDAADDYFSHYREFDEPGDNLSDASEIDGVDDNFKSAWFTEFGFTIEDTRDVAAAFQNLARETQEAVSIINRDMLIDYIVKNSALSRAIVTLCVEQFTLKTRRKWDMAPPGFSDGDWLPWRFRRRLSLVARPIVQLEDGSQARCAVAPAMIVHHIAKFASDVRCGRFDDKNFKQNGALSRWTGEINRIQGESFNDKVAQRFRDLGWVAKSNLSDGQILNRTSDDRFGDVDVLAWSRSECRLLVIECKDLSMDKTLGEIARRLSRFRGLMDKDGKRDDLRRHLDRCEILVDNKVNVENFVGMRFSIIEKLLIFSQPTSLQFHAAPGEHGVSMLAFRDLADFLRDTSNS